MIEDGQPGGGFLLHYGGQRIPFRVEYRPRKHLAISVLPDLRVEVVAPAGTALDAILPRVEKRAGWITVGRFFRVAVRAPKDAGRVRELLDGWYREHARRVFDLRLAGCLEAAAPLGLAEPPRVVVRRMAKRWGSCTRAGDVILNLDLIKAPVHCIDYVIIHELCHVKAHNHGKEFYRLLGRCLPDWEVRKKRLEAVVL
jgi:predicted metal-dependent hydrolase